MLLDLPVRFQRDDFRCGSVSLEMALLHDGISPGRWIRRLASPVNGLSAEALTAAMHAACGGHILAGAMDVALLRHLANRGRPVICLVTDPVSNGGHLVVSRGISRGRAFVNCPTHGRESYPIAEFERRWALSDTVGGWTLARYGVCGLPPE